MMIGIYTTEVKLEIIPGKDNWSGVSKTEYSINESEWSALPKNNILTLSEKGPYTIKVRTYDSKNNYCTTDGLEITLDIIKIGEIADKNCTINGEDYSSSNPVIPEGFMAINTETSSWDAEEGPQVSNGLVISDGVSEFVWIPVNGNIDDWLNEPETLFGDTIELSDLKSECEAMVDSVNKYGGFYVGRYELSNNSNEPQSVANVLPANKMTWYELYELCKKYNKTSSVTGSMIWGCQWDAMMAFIGDTEATKRGRVSHDGLDKPYLTGNGQGTGKYSGTVAYNDIINNIYDLEGNVSEWTLEANDQDGRISRGGSFANNFNPKSGAGIIYPDDAEDYLGSRLTLYINQ